MGAILAALKQGDFQNVKDLIQEGGNLDLPDESGITPLQYSIENGHIDIVRLLLMAGADPNVENGLLVNDGQLFIDSNNQSTEEDETLVIEHIIKEIQNLKSTSALHIAIKRNDMESLKLLLEYGADPNVLDLGCCSPLHWAATKNNLVAVKLLLDTKADPNLKDLAKSTALHEAVRKKNYEIVKLLLKYGASPNIEDISGTTPFDLVADDQQLLDIILLNCKSIPAGCVVH